MTRRITLAMLLVVSACAPTPPTPPPYDLTMAQNDCTALSAPFPLLSGCLQSQMQKYAPEWPARPDADLMNTYFSWLSAAGNRVAIGEISESEGRRQADELLARLQAIGNQRQAAIKQQALINALAGFAIMEAATPQPAYPAPQTTITCTTGPVNPVYGTRTTTCR